MRTRTSPEQERAGARGLLTVPLVAAGVGFGLASWAIEMALVMAVLFALVATAITVLFAYPLLRWLMRRGRANAVTTIVSGAILGNVPAAIAALGTYARSADGGVEAAGLQRAVMVGTLAGIAAAGGFWAVAGRHLTNRGES
jgi:hypothetical protein